MGGGPAVSAPDGREPKAEVVRNLTRRWIEPVRAALAGGPAGGTDAVEVELPAFRRPDADRVPVVGLVDHQIGRPPVETGPADLGAKRLRAVEHVGEILPTWMPLQAFLVLAFPVRRELPPAPGLDVHHLQPPRGSGGGRGNGKESESLAVVVEASSSIISTAGGSVDGHRSDRP